MKQSSKVLSKRRLHFFYIFFMRSQQIASRLVAGLIVSIY
jgi:hypothetical protein